MYISLFISAFLAATILPAQSEAVLAYQIFAAPDRAWFPVGRDKLEKAEGRYRKFGRYSLLLSWVPFIGDPITVVAGVLREPLWSFLVLVTIAKSSRYIIISMLVTGVT